MAVDQQKVTVTLPKPLLERLNDVVPKRKRSLFIAEAIEEHLELIEQNVALEEAIGAWSDVNHPDMRTEEDINQLAERLAKRLELTVALPGRSGPACSLPARTKECRAALASFGKRQSPLYLNHHAA